MSMDGNPVNLNDIARLAASGGDPDKYDGPPKQVKAGKNHGLWQVWQREGKDNGVTWGQMMDANSDIVNPKTGEYHNGYGLEEGDIVNVPTVKKDAVAAQSKRAGWSVIRLSSESDMDLDPDYLGPEPESNKPLGSTSYYKTRKKTKIEDLLIPENQQDLFDFTESVHPSHTGGGESPGGIN